MCGGLGFIIAGVIFFSWYQSEQTWKRIIAWLVGGWAGLSVLFYAILIFSS